MKFIGIILFIFILSLNFAMSEENQIVGIDEHLGENVPLDLKFYDENGKEVILKDLVNNKPTVISLVYYRCPGICSPLMNGLAETIGKTKLKAGTDYNVITVSFDPQENFEKARDKKKNYFNTFKIPFPENGWRFLTGTQENINKITSSVGFNYKKVDGQYVHAAAIYIISPEGKITRYLYGVSFLPFDLEMALTEASQGRIGPTINKVMSLCYVYNPKGKKYIFDITKISGMIILFFILIFGLYLIRAGFIKRQVKVNGTRNS
jgi:protein SCO1/2